MVATSKITQDRLKAFRVIPSAWYGGLSGRITTVFSSVSDQGYLTQEQDNRKTTVLVGSFLSYSGLNISPKLTPDIVITSEFGWSTMDRKTGNDLADWAYCLSARFQAQRMPFLGNPETSTDALILLCTHAVGLMAKTITDRFLLKDYSPPSLPSVETTADLLARVRAHLSLNTTELAQSLRIERATIYGWMKASHTPRPEHRQRLMTLAHLAQTWTQLCHEPLGDLKHAFIDGDSTLIDHLSAPDLNEIQIKRALAKLAERRKADAESKAVGAEKSIHQIARERGWEAVDPEIREQTIRGLSLGR